MSHIGCRSLHRDCGCDGRRVCFRAREKCFVGYDQVVGQRWLIYLTFAPNFSSMFSGFNAILEFLCDLTILRALAKLEIQTSSSYFILLIFAHTHAQCEHMSPLPPFRIATLCKFG